jgi:ABC-type transport system involved in multi-copper enzyme maturation permease subunit
MARVMRINADEKFGLFGLTLFLSTGCTALLALSLEASRIFSVERTERTLSSLMVLPFSTRQIIWEKIRGCLATSYALFVFMVISAACIACFALKELGKSGADGEGVFYFICFTTYAVSVALSFPVFIAWLSLKIRWGAFLVGGTIWTFGNWNFAVLCALVFREASAVILPSVSIVILGVLSTSIPRRLEQLAAEE